MMVSLTPLLNFAFDVWREDGEVRIHDAYKWLFHATLGGEHAVKDDVVPRRWLDREWDTLSEPFPNEQLVVPLRPDAKLLRISLRPYKALGGDKEAMLQMFIRSAKAFHANRKEFEEEWRCLGDYLRANGRQGHLRFADWRRLDKETNDQDYPAIDHSPEYSELKAPAYRVILAAVWNELQADK